MKNHTELPAVSFGEDCDYDTMHSVLTGWCARIWLPNVILVALWKGYGPGDNTTSLLVWSKEDDDYTNKVVINSDDILKVEIL